MAEEIAGQAQATCLNCGTALEGKYCFECGQSRDSHRRSVWALFDEFFEHLFELDSRVLRTLWALIARPGELSLAFREGRRQRYVPPARLYLFTSLALFVAIALSGLAILQLEVTKPGIETGAAMFQYQNAKVRAVFFEPPLPPPEAIPEEFARDMQAAQAETGGDRTMATIFQGILHAIRDPQTLNTQLTQWLPRLLFLLVPLLALLLAIFFHPKTFHAYFVDHVVMAAHLHTFLFVLLMAMLAAAPFVSGGWLPWALLGIMSVYSFVALWRFYGQSPVWTGVKGFLVGVLYIVFLLFPGLGLVLAISLMHT